MIINIIITLSLLILSAVYLKKKLGINNNVVLLFLTQPLVMASMPVIVFIGGIIAKEMAIDPSLATLPITLMVVGVAFTSIPAAMLAKVKGRKLATQTGFIIAILAALLAMLAILQSSFILFTLASFGFGISSAFIQQIRFAAIDSTKEKSEIPKVISLLMLSGLFAAFLGPEIAVAAKDLLPYGVGFAGAFLVLALLGTVALFLISFFKEPEKNSEIIDHAARPITTIIKQPIFIIAVLTAAIGYALMSYLMTATPLSMHHNHGHSLADTKWVIQSHIAAMFLPSLFTAILVKKIGLKGLLLVGTIIYAGVAAIAMSGIAVMHYWWALILLGIGWNFLFLTGTSLLPLSYQENEKHKVQATNDFILFGFQAVASLLAGWMLYQFGWVGVVVSSIPFIVVLILIYGYYHRYLKISG